MVYWDIVRPYSALAYLVVGAMWFQAQILDWRCPGCRGDDKLHSWYQWRAILSTLALAFVWPLAMLVYRMTAHIKKLEKRALHREDPAEHASDGSREADEEVWVEVVRAMVKRGGNRALAVQAADAALEDYRKLGRPVYWLVYYLQCFDSDEAHDLHRETKLRFGQET